MEKVVCSLRRDRRFRAGQDDAHHGGGIASQHQRVARQLGIVRQSAQLTAAWFLMADRTVGDKQRLTAPHLVRVRSLRCASWPGGQAFQIGGNGGAVFIASYGWWRGDFFLHRARGGGIIGCGRWPDTGRCRSWLHFPSPSTLVAGEIGGEPILHHPAGQSLAVFVAEQHVLGRVAGGAMAQSR